MDHFVGLDVSVKETSICIVDDAGKIVREVKVASEPEALLQVLTNTIYRFKRVGLEAGPLSQWLYSVLAEAGLPVICVETRHMRAVLKAQINKTDRNDARGIVRVGLYRPVHVKTLRSRSLDDADAPGPSVVSVLRMLLTHRKLLQSKAIAIENDLRATLRNFGHSGDGEVRGTHQGARREPPRPSGAGRADAHCPAGATRTDRHPASPFAGHCPG
jgi:transposase